MVALTGLIGKRRSSDVGLAFLDASKLNAIKQAIDADAEFRLAARFMSHTVRLAAGESACTVVVREGRVIDVRPGQPDEAPDLSIEASPDAWARFLQATPPPFHNHLFAAEQRRLFRVDGDQEAAHTHLAAVSRLLEVLRALQSGEQTRPEDDEVTASAGLEPIAGRYVRLLVQGVPYRVYFEESGQGIPLVCQHTAASDGRQWRRLLNDAEVTSRFRVLAPDLPYHGKSLPPESVEWWKQEYQLSKQFLLDFHTAFCAELGLKRPVYLGCSMGGHLAADLALERPELYRAVIGVEAGLGYGPRLAEAIMSGLVYFNHPHVRDDCRGAAMSGLTAPMSPESCRREIVWGYYQAAPPVFMGDMHYYIREHDMTDGRAERIDTSRVFVYLLTGEYDATTSPQDTRRLAGQVEGAKFVEMKELGHFGMSENYPAFRDYLLPVLREIEEAYRV